MTHIADNTFYRNALLLIEKNKWAEAHALVQDMETKDAARIHALLHRIEGDESNARYWYRQAGISWFSGSVEEELSALKAVFCK